MIPSRRGRVVQGQQTILQGPRLAPRPAGERSAVVLFGSRGEGDHRDPELMWKKKKKSCRGDRGIIVMSPLHDGAAASLLLGGIGILPLVDLGSC